MRQRTDDVTEEFAAVATDLAPPAIGPYSQAFIATEGRMLFTSGQIGVNPTTGKMVRGGVAEQTRQVMMNLRAVIRAAGGTLYDLVKVSIFLKNLEDFETVNAIYASYLEQPYPARATVEVGRLPMDALVEIDGIAVLPARSDSARSDSARSDSARTDRNRLEEGR